MGQPKAEPTAMNNKEFYTGLKQCRVHKIRKSAAMTIVMVMSTLVGWYAATTSAKETVETTMVYNNQRRRPQQRTLQRHYDPNDL